jgi:hypothetical protein
MRDVILDLLQQNPFVPFRIYLTSGSVHEARDPARVRLTEYTLRLGRLDGPPPPAFVDHYIISLDHVVRVEPLVADDPVVILSEPK